MPQPLMLKKLKLNGSMKNLHDLLELTPKKDVLFNIGNWNEKVGNQEIAGVTGKFGLGVQNESGQRLTKFCQENALIIANTLFQQHETTLQMVNTKIRLIIELLHLRVQGFPLAQLIKNPTAMWETWVRSLGWEDPLEKRKVTHSSILAWRTPWTV